MQRGIIHKNYRSDNGSIASSTENTDGTTDRVRVFARVRPLSAAEKSRGCKCILEPVSANGILVWDPTYLEASKRPDLSYIDPKCWSRSFSYDCCLWSNDLNDSRNLATQDRIFDTVGAPIVNWAIEGHNSCVFAYGQTGAGKSYTMMGDMKRDAKDYGLIPRICFSLFDALEQLHHPGTSLTTDNNSNNDSSSTENDYQVEFSHMEIYNETVRDLLCPSTNSSLRVREHPSMGVYVANLTSEIVTSFEEVIQLIMIGDSERTVAATNMNSHSSRSHAIVTLTIEQFISTSSTTSKTPKSTVTPSLKSSTIQQQRQQKTSRIHLVDLAGSERATLSGATGNRLRETNNINRSLSVLGDVIKCLGEAATSNSKRSQQQTSVHIPYRNSLLTMVLKDSLGRHDRGGGPMSWHRELGNRMVLNILSVLFPQRLSSSDPICELSSFSILFPIRVCRSRQEGTPTL